MAKKNIDAKNITHGVRHSLPRKYKWEREMRSFDVSARVSVVSSQLAFFLHACREFLFDLACSEWQSIITTDRERSKGASKLSTKTIFSRKINDFFPNACMEGRQFRLEKAMGNSRKIIEKSVNYF